MLKAFDLLIGSRVRSNLHSNSRTLGSELLLSLLLGFEDSDEKS